MCSIESMISRFCREPCEVLHPLLIVFYFSYYMLLCLLCFLLTFFYFNCNLDSNLINWIGLSDSSSYLEVLNVSFNLSSLSFYFFLFIDSWATIGSIILFGGGGYLCLASTFSLSSVSLLRLPLFFLEQHEELAVTFNLDWELLFVLLNLELLSFFFYFSFLLVLFNGLA